MRRRQIERQRYLEQEEKRIKEAEANKPKVTRLKQREGYMSCPWCQKEFTEHGLRVHMNMVHIKGKKGKR